MLFSANPWLLSHRPICLHVRSARTDLLSASPRLPAQPPFMSWDCNLRPAPVLLPQLNKMNTLHWWYNVKTWTLASTVGHCRLFWNNCEGGDGQWTHRKFKAQALQWSFGESFGRIKTCVVPEPVTDKMKAYPIPRNMKDIQVFVGILRSWRTFIPHLAQCLHPLYYLVKKEHIGLPWWRSGWESACQCRGHGFEPWSVKIPHAAEQLGPWTTTTEPARLELVLRNKRGCDSERPAHRDEEWPPLTATGESPRTETKTQHRQK